MELHRLDPARWKDVGYSFNRKEKKDHGEGGGIVGASLKGKRVLVLDDVLTAGTAMRETMKLVTEEGGKAVGFLVALDRLEVKPGGESAPEKERVSAMGELRREWGVKTASIATLDDLIKFLKRKDEEGETQRLQKRLGEGETQMLEEYRRRYGTRD
jgi:orotate phosphoribosyltransferase